MQNEMQKPSDKLKAARHTFSLLGFSALLLLVGQLLVSVLVGICIGLFFPEGNTPAWLTMLLAYIGVYGVAFPLSALPLCRLPAAAPDKGKISVQHFLAFLPVLYLCSYVGALLGNLVGSLASDALGLQITNGVDALMENNTLLLFFITVILAPICEEWFFRKLLIDRTRGYGEKLAVVVSALLFAFYHTNIYQFFYAFFIGLVFGYVYLRTGKVAITALMHAIFNFFGGIISAEVLRVSDIMSVLEAETIEAQVAAIKANPVGIGIFFVYGFLCLGLLIGGCVLLVKYRKKIFFKPAAEQLPPDTEGAAAFVNVGMLIYIIVSAAAAFILGSMI